MSRTSTSPSRRLGASLRGRPRLLGRLIGSVNCGVLFCCLPLGACVPTWAAITRTCPKHSAPVQAYSFRPKPWASASRPLVFPRSTMLSKQFAPGQILDYPFPHAPKSFIRPPLVITFDRLHLNQNPLLSWARWRCFETAIQMLQDVIPRTIKANARTFAIDLTLFDIFWVGDVSYPWSTARHQQKRDCC